MVAEAVALGAFLVTLIAELLHQQRIAQLTQLAFGPAGRPRRWASAAPWIRAAAVGGLTWGLMTLLLLPPKVHRSASVDRNQLRHLVLLLDVSPSMALADAGPSKKQPRRERAKDLVYSFLDRAGAEFRISVVAFYNGAKPVVVDTIDMEVIRNILGDLPMSWAFEGGNTRLFDGLEQVAEIAHPWNPDDATLLILTDGDTVPADGMPRMPASIDRVLVLGVGDTRAGSFINGRQSRQDVTTLRQVAARLRGEYHDGNEKQIPTDLVRFAASAPREGAFDALSLREYALMLTALGAAVFAGLPLLLNRYGTSWRPGVRQGAGSPRLVHSGVPGMTQSMSPARGVDRSRDAAVAPGKT